MRKIERWAENNRILAPVRRYILVYKNTPLPKAVADFQEKSGYIIHLHDPDGRAEKAQDHP